MDWASGSFQNYSNPKQLQDEALNPFYFGGRKNPLFGISYSPGGANTRKTGVLICNPLGQEHIRAHRSLKLLAVNLAKQGFHVLRFDYFGTGDSAGDGLDAGVARWEADIKIAIEEMRGRFGVHRFHLIGIRFGATMAYRAAAARNDVASMVLWDPVVDGNRYMSMILFRHQEWLKDTYPKLQELSGNGKFVEVSGFPLRNEFVSDVRSIDLKALASTGGKKVLVLTSEEESATQDWITELKRAHREANGAPATHVSAEHIDGIKPWIKHDSADKTLVPARLLQRILDWTLKYCE